jgi:2-keto-4-pentenoate hydratase/2-oxohepta-3-ene-1,7-dioic acid hydratase in catechol pathway
MKLARFKDKKGTIYNGIVEKDTITVVEGSFLSDWKPTRNTLKLSEVTLLAPIIPTSLLALGLNYKAHAEEGNEKLPKAPALFIKAITAINDPGAPIVLPELAPDEVDYEAELAVVIRKTARRIRQENVKDYILGYTCANDVSARDCQFKDIQWARGKSFDSFAPLGPWIETELDPNNCAICCRVNGRVLQNSNTSLMIFNVSYVVSYLSMCMTMIPGTVILTGTPAGCGFARKPPIWLRHGDTVEVEVEGIGILKNPVVSEV